MWGIVKILENEETGETAEETVSHLVVYVDDVMVAAPRGIAERFLGRLETEWKCSPVEWANDKTWTKFFAASNSCGLLMVNPCGWDSLRM